MNFLIKKFGFNENSLYFCIVKLKQTPFKV